MNTENQLATIGQRLRWARQQAGLSQARVAAKLGWHRPTISQIEAGQRSVKTEEVTAFAELYDVKDVWLLRGDDALDSDPKVELAARELAKLSEKDLTALLRVIRVLKSGDGD